MQTTKKFSSMSIKLGDKLRYYFAFRGQSGYFTGHNIIKLSQVKTLVAHNKGAEFFSALSYYYPNDEVLGCPLAFDVDFDDDLGMALTTARRIAAKLDLLRIEYRSFFSGSEGFHIVVPTLIYGDRSHMVCKAIKRTLFDWKGVDEHIYKNRSLFRLEGSINKKTGLYKIPVDLTDDLDVILEKAKTPCELRLTHDIDKDIDLSGLISMSSEKLAEMNVIHRREATLNEFTYDTVPCIKKLWQDIDPPRDDWHSIIYTLAKDAFNEGLDTDEVIDRFDSHIFWGSICGYGYSRRSYTKIIHSLSFSSKWGIGCKSGGLSADLMLDRCSQYCWFNNDLSFEEMLGGKDETG